MEKENFNKEQTILITGANGQLGSVVSQYFLSKNFRVIAIVHNEKDLNFIPYQNNLQTVSADLGNEEATKNLVEKLIVEYSTIDAALLLAGGFASGKIQETSSSGIRQQIALNFETAYHVVRPLLKNMADQNNGRIVLIGSRPAIKPIDGKNMIAYSLAKSLLFRLAEYINAEAKGKNISATVVVPATIDTEANRKSMPESNPGDWVKPYELAEIFEFIISEKANPLKETILKVYKNS